MEALVHETCDLMPPPGAKSISDVPLTKDGYLAVEARVARTGIQVYKASELGLEGDDTMRVMRPEEVVFDRSSMSTYAHRPVTVGHPPEFVDSGNWRQHAVGFTGGEVVRDGHFVRVPMIITDKQTIDSIRGGGAKQLSLGYDMTLSRQSTATHDAVVSKIEANHLSIVAQARGGPELRLGDEADPPAGKGNQTMADAPAAPVVQRTVAIDGISVRTDESGAEILARHLATTQDQSKARDAELETLRAQAKTKDAEIETLKKKVEDSKMSDAEVETMIADAMRVREVAVVILGKDAATSAPVSELRKAVVAKRLGADKVKDWNPDQFKVSFDTIAADTKTDAPGQGAAAPAAAPSFAGIFDQSSQLSNLERSRKSYDAFLENSWRTGDAMQTDEALRKAALNGKGAS